tara:strand:+ start:2719 stop:2922 length:204 start_codon:yes stop_codon:yes gene_type:complete
MGIGDLVIWKKIKEFPSIDAYYDVGIIVDVEYTDATYSAFPILLKVYFIKLGLIWCAPGYLEVLSKR